MYVCLCVCIYIYIDIIYIYSRFFFSDDNSPARSVRAARDGEIENVDMDLEDSDFEPGGDTELLGLFFPEVCI